MMNSSDFRLEDVCIKVRNQGSTYSAVIEHWWTEQVLGRGEGRTEAEAVGQAVLAVRDVRPTPPSMQLQMAFEAAQSNTKTGGLGT